MGKETYAMTIKPVIVCDKCGEPIEGVHSPMLAFFVRVYTDAAGAGDVEYTYGDLCPTCLLKWWHHVKARLGLAKDAKLTETWKAWVKK